jgi:4-amino-4-deoxy-L-arabinose transferase-like glycosyltransferase
MAGSMADAGSRGVRATWLVLLLFGALLRLPDVARPFDGRSLAAWREADYTGIARSFARESLDPLHPRVDWRGETPGYAEMELPVLPWIAGALDRIFGENELRMRWLSAAASLAALLVFKRLAQSALPTAGALAATAFFAAQPLLIFLAPAMQPDGLMVLVMLLAVGRLWRYEQSGAARELVAAALLTGAATLVKAPAALLGFLLIEAVLRRHGLRALLRREVWGAAVCALLPVAAWYGWVHRFWLEYGLSLGLSNETHRLSIAALVDRQQWLGNVRVEIQRVFTWPGLLLVGAALLLRPRRTPAPPSSTPTVPQAGAPLGGSPLRWAPLRWAAAVALFYFLMLDTSGDAWAFYYHALSCAPAALLMGTGFGALLERATRWRVERRGLACALKAAVIALAITTVCFQLRSARGLRKERDEQVDLPRAFECAEQFRPLIPAGARITFAGGVATDRHGHPVAHNGSTWFAWLDRRGLTYVEGDATLPHLAQFAIFAPIYWIASGHELADPAFRAAVEALHRRVASCGNDYHLFELRSVH